MSMRVLLGNCVSVSVTFEFFWCENVHAWGQTIQTRSNATVNYQESITVPPMRSSPFDWLTLWLAIWWNIFKQNSLSFPFFPFPFLFFLSFIFLFFFLSFPSWFQFKKKMWRTWHSHTTFDIHDTWKVLVLVTWWYLEILENTPN